MTNTETKLPFMVSALLAVGAWLACLLSMLVMGLASVQLAGAVLVGFAAVFTYKMERTSGLSRVFFMQVALAFSICGKGMLIFGLMELWPSTSFQRCLLMWGATALSYPVFTQKLDRTIMAFGSALMAFLVVFEYLPALVPYMEPAAILLFVLALVLFFVPNENIRPIAWGMLLACTVPFALLLLGEVKTFLPQNALALGVCLVGVYAWRAREKFHIGVAALILVLSYLTNNGTMMGAALLALAYSQNRLSLKIAGTAVFGLSLVWLYYHMQTTLLVKSFYLWASGLALLALYVGLKRRNYAR